MKIKYKILAIVLIAEFLILKFLQELNIQLNNSLGSFLTATVLLIPLYVLFYNLARDASKLWKKILFSCIFWHLIVCYSSYNC